MYWAGILSILSEATPHLLSSSGNDPEAPLSVDLIFIWPVLQATVPTTGIIGSWPVEGKVILKIIHSIFMDSASKSQSGCLLASLYCLNSARSFWCGAVISIPASRRSCLIVSMGIFLNRRHSVGDDAGNLNTQPSGYPASSSTR